MGRPVLLIRITGSDRPGILAEVLGIVGRADGEICDIEQITIRGRLNLDLIVRVGESGFPVADLAALADAHGLTISTEQIEVADRSGRPSLVVTVLAPELPAAELARVADAIAGGGGNIERIIRLAESPVVSFELHVSGGDEVAMRAALLTTSQSSRIDVAVQREGLHRRATRLVVMDVDSTLIQDEVIDLLAAHAGCADAVSGITERTMRGELDFEASLRARVELLRGLPVGVFEAVKGEVRLTPGSRTFVRTLRRLGYRTAIVSGGFTPVTDHLQALLHLDHAFANELEVRDGVLTGRVLGEVVDRAGKARLLQEVASLEGIPLEQVVAIGDGANDLDMLAVAGLGIAFNAKPSVRRAAQTAVNVPYLDAILLLLGVPREDVEAVDD